MSPLLMSFLVMLVVTLVQAASMMKDTDNSIPKNGIPTCAPGEYLGKYELDPDHEHHGEHEKEDHDGGRGDLSPHERELFGNMTAMDGQVTDAGVQTKTIGHQIVFSLTAIPLMTIIANRIN